MNEAELDDTLPCLKSELMVIWQWG